MFYVYAYLRASDDSPYYVGKGSNGRAFAGHNVSVPKDRSKIIFWHTDLEEAAAFELEKFYIKLFGRKDIGTGILHNRTDGGDGQFGRIVSEEYKERLRQEKLGNPGTFGKVLPMLGKKHNEETKAKMRAAAINNGARPPQPSKEARARGDSKRKAMWADPVKKAEMVAKMRRSRGLR